jgi:Fe-S cluster assembly protein SufD
MTEPTFETRCIEAARHQPVLQSDGLQWLQPLRDQGLQHFGRIGLPTRKTETWRYTSVYPLTQGDFLRLAEQVNPAEQANPAADAEIEGLESYVVLFRNGVLDLEHSTLADLPFELIPFSQANGEQREMISRHLGTLVTGHEHPFAHLNAGWMQDGAFIRIGKDTQIDKPIQIVFESSAESGSFTAQPRLFIKAERHSQAVILEQHIGPATTAEVFSNTVTEIVLEEGAKLRHYQLNVEPENVLHIGNVQVELGGHAEYESHQFALGGKLKRRELQVALAQPGASARLFGTYLGRNSQQVDFRTVLDHKAPHCTSTELIKGLVRDEARAVFNGRIHIHRDAQQTSAEMSNKNLLLSKTAEVNTKPELEIYADDVKCSHGATVGQLDGDALFYLRSRGISTADACQILSDAFVYEVIDQMPDEAIRAYGSRWVEAFHDHTPDQLG